MGATITDTTVLDCGHMPSEHSEFSTGYGRDEQGHTYCYACCADRDKAYMRANGRICLYLTLEDAAIWGHSSVKGKGYKVENWPGSLSLPVKRYRIGRHNMAKVRYDVWFYFEGAEWHGVTYGNNTQICHCKRNGKGA